MRLHYCENDTYIYVHFLFQSLFQTKFHIVSNFLCNFYQKQFFNFSGAGKCVFRKDELITGFSNDMSTYIDEKCRKQLSIWEDQNSLRIPSIISGVEGAQNSLPCYLWLKPSNIPTAGLGIFTKIPINKGVLFGPYKVKTESLFSVCLKLFNGLFLWRKSQFKR